MNITQVIEAATVDQQLEQHAVRIETIERDAYYEIGRELAAVQELHKYKRDGGGFTGWLAERLPRYSERGAYQAIAIFKGIDPTMFATLADIKPGILEQVAKAPPDVQALIAERIEAGEIFTAAKVKELRQQTATESAALAAKAAQAEIDDALARIDQLEKLTASDAREAKRQAREIAKLEKAIRKHEKEIADFESSLPKPGEAEKQAAKMGGGVVLGSDMKFHSGKTAEERILSAEYMTVWSILNQFTREDFPLPGRVVAGCGPDFQGQLLRFCKVASTYISQLEGALHGQAPDEKGIE